MNAKPRMLLALLLAGLLTGCGASRSVAPHASGSSSPSGGKKILQIAESQIGVKYRFGGDSPSGFDCSGLAYWTHNRAGIDIPRTTSSQFKKGKKISRGNLKAGDLVFFTTYKAGASHVGTYDGKGGFVHAPSSGKKVSRAAMDNSYWKPRYLGARRYW